MSKICFYSGNIDKPEGFECFEWTEKGYPEFGTEVEEFQIIDVLGKMNKADQIDWLKSWYRDMKPGATMYIRDVCITETAKLLIDPLYKQVVEFLDTTKKIITDVTDTDVLHWHTKQKLEEATANIGRVSDFFAPYTTVEKGVDIQEMGISMIYPEGQKWAFEYSTLEALLKEAGFTGDIKYRLQGSRIEAMATK